MAKLRILFAAVRRRRFQFANDAITPNTSILVADDEPDARALIAANLHNAGFHVIRAEDGESALNKARNHSPALVVLDRPDYH